MEAYVASDGRIECVRREIPQPADGEVLIQVSYAGVNRADLAQVKGTYLPPEGQTDILGLEVVGRRVDTGEKVMALLVGGGYAEYVAVPAGQVVPIGPLEQPEAATITESLATAWSNLVDACSMKEGDRVLIQGGTGSLGIVACQLALSFGCEVIATAGDESRRAVLRDLGVQAIDHGEAYDQRDINVALDLVGEDLGKIVKTMADGGNIAVVGIQGGNQAQISVFDMMKRRVSVHGTTLRSRPGEDKARIVAAAWDYARPLYESGQITTFVHEIVPLRSEKDVSRAHEIVAREHPVGKVVLEVTSLNQP